MELPTLGFSNELFPAHARRCKISGSSTHATPQLTLVRELTSNQYPESYVVHRHKR